MEKASLMNCPNCSEEIPDTALVCGFCGARIMRPDLNDQKNTSKKNFPKWAIWLIAVFGGVIIICLAISIISKIISNRRIKTLKAGQIPAITEHYIDSQDAASSTPETNQTLAAATVMAQINNQRVVIAYYTAQEGDTCKIVAEKLNVSIQEIISENDLDENCVINVGDILAVPILTVDVNQPLPVVKPNDLSLDAVYIFDVAQYLSDRVSQVYITGETNLLIKTGWCAPNSEQLNQEMESLQISVMINGKEISSSLSLAEDESGGYVCRQYTGVIGEWPENEYVLTVNRVFTQPIYRETQIFQGITSEVYWIFIPVE
jgi:LysM repeat protein